MKVSAHYIILLSLFSLLVPSEAASNQIDTSPDNIQHNDSINAEILADSLLEAVEKELREGRVVIDTMSRDYELGDDEQLRMSDYKFLRHAANIIQLNGDDWTGLKERYNNMSHDVFSIVHIGDSHIQADICSGAIRKMFQDRSGDAGRGLIVPLKIAGTNEPNDYIISIDSRYNASKLMKKPWATEMAFTGVGVEPKSNVFNVSIDTSPHGESAFKFIRIYHKGKLKVTEVRNADSQKLSHYVDSDEEEIYTDVFLDFPTVNVTLALYAPSIVTIHGFSLWAEQPGVIYNTIGNNGATYTSYNNLEGFGAGIATLYPDLILVSLGTNEAFGRTDAVDFYSAVDRLVKDIKTSNPDAKILLTTPMECQKKVRIKNGTKRSTRYQVPALCKELRSEILRYCREHNIAVYDWYEVAGGEGASNDWLAHSLLSKDRVHHTAKGYELNAVLLHSALERVLCE